MSPSIIPVKYADDLTMTELLMGSWPYIEGLGLEGQELSLAISGAKTMDMVISSRTDDNIPSPPSPVILGHVISRVFTFKLLGIQISNFQREWISHPVL